MTATKIYPLFPQTPFTQENEEREQELSNSVSESLTTGARACARTREEIEQIIDGYAAYYCETFGTLTCPPVAKQRMRICIGSGMDPELIRTAMDEAAMAPRPSWAYANAILMRLLQEECFTLGQYEDRQIRWANRHCR